MTVRIFTSCSLDRWLASGGEVDPRDDSHHNISNAIAIPGLYSFGGATGPGTPTAPDDAMVLWCKAGEMIKLGGDDADDPVVRKSDLDAVVSRLESHTHNPPALASGSSYALGTDTAFETSDPKGSFASPPIVPDEPFLTMSPDWICEVLSRSSETRDRLEKMPLYASVGVRHAWLVQAKSRSIEAFRLHDGMWLAIGVYRDTGKARIEPFDAIELDLARLWAKTPLPTRASDGATYYQFEGP